MGIRHVGNETAITIANDIQAVLSLRDLGEPRIKMADCFEYLKGLSIEEFQKLPDIGVVVGESLFNYFHQEENVIQLNRLIELGLACDIIYYLNPYSRFQGKTVVLTGTLTGFTRERAEEIIRQEGGSISSAVSVQTSYVLVGDKPGSKLDKARELGVQVITEDDFKKIIE